MRRRAPVTSTTRPSRGAVDVTVDASTLDDWSERHPGDIDDLRPISTPDRPRVSAPLFAAATSTGSLSQNRCLPDEAVDLRVEGAPGVASVRLGRRPLVDLSRAGVKHPAELFSVSRSAVYRTMERGGGVRTLLCISVAGPRQGFRGPDSV